MTGNLIIAYLIRIGVILCIIVTHFALERVKKTRRKWMEASPV